MSRSTPSTYKTRNWRAYSEALRRQGSLTIWLDLEMSWEAAPTGRRGRRQSYSDAAIQTCLSMKVLFGIALRQLEPWERHWSERPWRGGFVESLLRLVGLNWRVPDFRTLSRRQKTLAVNIPYRGSKGPLHLLIDRTGIKVEGQGEPHAREHGGRKRPSPWSLGPLAFPWLDWRNIHIGIDEQSLEVRAVEITGSHIGDGERCSATGSSASRTCSQTCLPRSRQTRRSDRSLLMVPMTHANAMTRTPSAARTPLFRRGRTRSPGDDHRWSRGAQRGSKSIEVLWLSTLATMERIPPTEPRRNEDALFETSGPAVDRAGLRPPGFRYPSSHRRPERLHRYRHNRHRVHRIGLSRER